MASIATIVGGNLRRRKNETTMFDKLVDYHAERAAAGINPSINRNSVIRVMIDANDMRPAYRGIRLWSSFDRLPNAPRIFYALLPLPENLVPDAKPNSRLMLVVSKHDQANELNVYAQISTRTRTQLRNLGAGSI